MDGSKTTNLVEIDPQCLSLNIILWFYNSICAWVDAEVSNLISLSDLNENALLHNLRIRFAQDDIYTSVSSILIAVVDH